MLRGAIVLAALCYFDLLSTIIFINLGMAAEAGPVLADYAREWGLPGLILAKLTMVGLGFFAIETAWRKKLISPHKAGRYYNAGVLIFILLYLGLVMTQHVKWY